MQIFYDPEVDALSIVFRDTTVTTKDLGDGLVAEYDAAGKLAGLELLDVSKLSDPEALRTFIARGQARSTVGGVSGARIGS